MFLASAYGFETGPYGSDHIVLQPVISCGPCNPNKPCSKPDCHDQISPELVARLVSWHVGGMTGSVPEANPDQVIVYRSFFDEFGFCDLEPLNSATGDWRLPYRQAYRKLWISDLAGYEVPVQKQQKSALQLVSPIEGLGEVLQAAEKGEKAIDELVELIRDVKSDPQDLRRVNDELTEIDREIEQTGFHFSHLGPVTRMFIFSKENIVGTDPISLASQMKEHYQRLSERCLKLNSYFGN